MEKYQEINLPNKVKESEVEETLMSIFSHNFCLDEVKKLMPKIKLTNVSTDMIDKALVTKICDKYAFLNSEINKDVNFQ